tara:strand:- start:401 stop:673 length:273 start_codon:yes stop_codon:yes gene_type:complete
MREQTQQSYIYKKHNMKTSTTIPTNYSQAFATILRLEKTTGYSTELIEQKKELINAFNKDEEFFFPCKYSADVDADVILNLYLLCKRLAI